jgi:hypothetical protein
MGAMDTLTTTRDALALIPGVASCKVGMEMNISPRDYPLIRLVPSTLTPGAPYGARTIDTLITFGAQVTESEGLEAVYAALFDLELAIREAVRALGGRYLTTVTDQDALPFVDGRPSPYKLMAVRVELRESP